MSRYEQMKFQLILDHPMATPAEYTLAMRAIAKRLGL